MSKIFAQWDKGSKGVVTVEDMMNGIKKAGINLTHEQAVTLFASAKSDAQSAGLSESDFKAFLFSGDESFRLR